MREIKFKAWIMPYEMMVEVQRINFDTRTIEVKIGEGDLYEFDFEEIKLIQYTGLKDKNGVEIYEGDIVQCSQKGQKMKGIVTFNKGMWSWQYGKERNDSYLYEVVKRWKGVIVGNIWEDGELIYDCKKTEKD